MTQSLPLVSIIVPVHDSAPFLARCLKSILDQSYSQLQLIAVDDASTDSSPEILRQYAQTDRRMSLLSTGSVPLGPAAARNLGMTAIKGEYFLFMDSDDVLYPHAVETLLNALQRFPKAAYATAPWQSFYGSVPEIPQFLPDVSSCTISGREGAWIMLCQTGDERGITVSPCVKLFRASLSSRLHFPAGMLYEDLGCLATFTASLPTIAYVPAPLMAYRLHESSILGHFTAARLDVLCITLRLRRSFRGDQVLKKAADTRAFAAIFNMLLHLTALPDNHPSADLRYVKARLCRLLRLLRLRVLTAPHVRLRDRLGAILAYCPGPRLLTALLGRSPRLLAALLSR